MVSCHDYRVGYGYSFFVKIVMYGLGLMDMVNIFGALIDIHIIYIFETRMLKQNRKTLT